MEVEWAGFSHFWPFFDPHPEPPKTTNTWPRASGEGPLWNIKLTPMLVFAIYIYVEHRVEHEAQKVKENTYIYEEHRVEHQIH